MRLRRSLTASLSAELATDLGRFREEAADYGATGTSYWDWQEMLKPNRSGFFPYTPPTNLLYGLREALLMMREEGLANGTLKQIFREEIKKSYEEYVDQIGRDFAESSTHFQDALNELLAAGKKMF